MGGLDYGCSCLPGVDFLGTFMVIMNIGISLAGIAFAALISVAFHVALLPFIAIVIGASLSGFALENALNKFSR
jgi:hypothetical protein